MSPSPDAEAERLVLLLEALDSVLQFDSAPEVLGEDCIKEFAAIRLLVESWLRGESPLPKEERLAMLTTFTTALVKKLPLLRAMDVEPSRLLH